MKVTTNEQAITRSNNVVEKQMGINADEVFWEALSSTIYSTKRWITEYAQNASDADPNWTLQLPSIINPFCLFIDNGLSMSKDFMLDQGEFEGCGFCTAFSSTKRGTNDSSGGFGIGRLTGPQGTMFECRNQDGFIRTYVLMKNEKGIPSVMLTSEEESAEGTHTGVTVKVPVSSRETHEIRQAAQKALRFFNPLPSDISEPKIAKNYGDVIFLSKSDSYYYSRSGPSLIIGGYEYSISSSELTTAIDNRLRALMTKYNGSLPTEIDNVDSIKYSKLSYTRNVLNLKELVLKIPIGSVDVALNRENLRYTEKTIEMILSAIETAMDVIKEELTKEIADSETLWEARCTFYEVFKSFDNVKSIVNPRLIQFNGQELCSEKYGYTYGGLSIPFLVKTFGMKYGRTKKSKFSGMDMHSVSYTDTVVPNKVESVFIVDDDASMINERVEKYLLDSGILNGYNSSSSSNIYVLHIPKPDDDVNVGTRPNSTTAKTYTLNEQIAYLGNPRTILATTLPLPEKIKSKKSATVKANSIFEIKLNSGYGGGTLNNVYNKIDISQMPISTVWVPVNNKSPEYDNLQELMNSRLLSNVQVFGVPKCDRSLIPSTWIELKDYAVETVGDVETIQKFEYVTKVLKTVDRNNLSEFHQFVCSIADFVDIAEIVRYNDIVMWLKSFDTAELRHKRNLADHLNMAKEEWVPKKEINLVKSIREIVEKYPMIKLLASLRNNFTDETYKLIETSIKVVRV